MLGYSDSFLRDATSCFYIFPFSLRYILARIFKNTKETFPQEPSACYLAVTSFLFLRFICPAIQSPQLFGLFYGTLSSHVQRTLTLTSKIIQKVANFCEFDPSIESYASPLNHFVPDYHAVILIFIDELCGIDLSSTSNESQSHQMVDLSNESIPSFNSHNSQKKPKGGLFSFLSLCFGFLPVFKSKETLYHSGDNMFKGEKSQGDYSQELHCLNDPIQGIDKLITFKEYHLGVLARHIFHSTERMLLFCKNDQERAIIYSNFQCIKLIKDKYALENGNSQRLQRLKAMQKMEYERVMDEIKTREERNQHTLANISKNDSIDTISSHSSLSEKENLDSYVVYKAPIRSSIMIQSELPIKELQQEQKVTEDPIIQQNNIDSIPTQTPTQTPSVQAESEPKFFKRQTSRMSVLDKLKDLSKNDPQMQFSSISNNSTSENETSNQKNDQEQTTDHSAFQTILEEPDAKTSSDTVSLNPSLIPRVASFRTNSFLKMVEKDEKHSQEDTYLKFAKFNQEGNYKNSDEALRQYNEMISNSTSQDSQKSDQGERKGQGETLLNGDSTLLYTDSKDTSPSSSKSNSNRSSQESIQDATPIAIPIPKRNPSEINVGALMGLKPEVSDPNQRIIQIGNRRLTLSLNSSGIQMIQREKSPGLVEEERPVLDNSDDEDDEGENDIYVERVKQSTRKASAFISSK